MPALYGEEKDADTLIVELADKVTGLHAFLYYSVWEERDIITRCVKFVNQGTDAIVLTKAASMNLDLMSGDWELMHFHIYFTDLRISPSRLSVPHYSNTEPMMGKAIFLKKSKRKRPFTGKFFSGKQP